MLNDYQIVDDQWVELLEGPYAGIVYRYGRVQLIEDNDHLRIKFEYEVKGHDPVDNDFKDYIGPILTELIEQGLVNNSIVYAGGINESRAENSSEFDSQ